MSAQFSLLKLAVIACVTIATLYPYNAMAQMAGFGDALVDAADQGNTNSVTAILKEGHDANTTGAFGATPLMRAAYNGHSDIATALLKAGANPNTKDIGGATALHLAARKGNAEIISLLYTYNVDINALDSEGWTPLMRAAANDQAAAVSMLLSKGADASITTPQGETVKQIAANASADDIITLLDSSGATASPSLPEIASTNRGSFDLSEPNIEPVNEFAFTSQDTKVSDGATSADSTEIEATIADMDDALLTGPMDGVPAQNEMSAPTLAETNALNAATDDNSPIIDLTTESAATEPPSIAAELPSELEPKLEEKPSTSVSNAMRAESPSNLTANAPKPILKPTQPKITKAPFSATSNRMADEDSSDFKVVTLREGEHMPWEEVPHTDTSPKNAMTETAPAITKVEVESESPKAIPLSLADATVASKTESTTTSAPPARTSQPPRPLVTLPREAVEEESERNSLPQLSTRMADSDAQTIVNESPTMTTPKPQVEVAEAIRVPLSIESPSAIETSPSFSSEPTSESQNPVRYYPSRAATRPSLWVQIGQFNDSFAAETFWSELGHSAPSLTHGLRFRSIKPYMSQQSSLTSARIGPMQAEDQVNTLCDYAMKQNLSCKIVRDMGNSVAARYTRERRQGLQRYRGNMGASSSTQTAPGLLSTGSSAIQQPVSALLPASNQYWAQIGSYSNVMLAEEMWQNISEVHSDILAGHSHIISTPRYSSSTTPVTRLKVGPFASRLDAATLCEGLKARYINCLPVKG